MTQTIPSGGRAAYASAVTLALSAEQLKALGVHSLPAAGATVQLRATATVSRPAKGATAGDADGDADSDTQDAAGTTDAPDVPAAALTLHLTGLTLTQAPKAPDQVLYGRE